MVNRQAGESNKKVILTIGAIILVAIAVGVFVYTMNNKQPVTKQPTTSLSEQDQKDQAAIKAKIDKETDKNKKVALMYDYGDYYINAGQYDNALDNALAIEKLEPTDASAGVIAHVYEVKQDYKNAAKYYEIAMQRTGKPTSKSANSPYNDYRILKEAAEAKS